MKTRLEEALKQSELFPDRLIVALASKTNQKQSSEVKLWCCLGGVIFPLKPDPTSYVDNGSFVRFIARCANRHHNCHFAVEMKFNRPDVQLGFNIFR